MLIDTRKQSNSTEGFNPNVQNEALPPKATGGQKAAWVIIFCIIFGILTLWICPLVIWFTKKNWFNKMQMKANQATSGIDIQLAQRRDTLVKLVDATKSSMKYEKDLLTEVTKLRSMKIDSKNAVEASNKIESNFARFLATFEQYPQLQSTKAIRDLMDNADYQEREISAARRLYNSVATEFNGAMFTFPSIVIVSKMQLVTLPLFVASAVQKQDVSLKLDM